MPQIRAAIYDMDGLLIDSEPFWHQAETEVFGSVGVRLTPAMCLETVGLRMDAIVEHWFSRYPWREKTRAEVGSGIARRVAELVALEARLLPGVEASIALCREHGLQLAVCSSSPALIIEATLKHFGLRPHFAVVHSADAEALGKPHPAPYLSVARLLGVAPEECVVFEDSLNGAISGRAARMRVVAVPSAEQRSSTKFDFCDAKLASLEEFSSGLLERLSQR